MQIDKNPVYRKVIIPWYDSETICFIMIIFLIFVCSFSIAGVSVAINHAAYQEYAWLPILLTSLSTYALISASTRLILRLFFSDRETNL